jgi:UDP-N-acetylmuramyl pentapeptide phosphotransferase/UDP-N-acetylglucosamine-1-phosphate transferase
MLAAGISLLDDWRGLPVLLRLAAQLLAALWCVLMWLRPEWPLAMSLILVAAAVWMCNLYNFMDGSDGLAGGMAVIGFGSYALAASIQGDASLSVLSLVVAGATIPFLARNFHPASIFMGDAGSVSLGLLAAMLGAAGWLHGAWSAWFPLVVFSPFIVDATLTLLRRMARGERFWRAHREHYYQKLVRMGWGHRRTALAEYALMLVAATLAVGIQGREQSVQAAAAIAWLAILLLAAGLIERRWRAHPASTFA